MNGKRKAESGKLLFFGFRLELKTEPTHEARAEAACRLCRGEAVKPEGQPTLRSESRESLHTLPSCEEEKPAQQD